MEDIIIKKFKDVTIIPEKDDVTTLFGFAVGDYLYENNLSILNEKVADKTVIEGIITSKTTDSEIDVFIATSMAFEASIIIFDINEASDDQVSYVRKYFMLTKYKEMCDDVYDKTSRIVFTDKRDKADAIKSVVDDIYALLNDLSMNHLVRYYKEIENKTNQLCFVASMDDSEAKNKPISAERIAAGYLNNFAEVIQTAIMLWRTCDTLMIWRKDEILKDIVNSLTTFITIAKKLGYC